MEISKKSVKQQQEERLKLYKNEWKLEENFLQGTIEGAGKETLLTGLILIDKKTSEIKSADFPQSEGVGRSSPQIKLKLSNYEDAKYGSKYEICEFTIENSRLVTTLRSIKLIDEPQNNSPNIRDLDKLYHSYLSLKNTLNLESQLIERSPEYNKINNFYDSINIEESFTKFIAQVSQGNTQTIGAVLEKVHIIFYEKNWNLINNPENISRILWNIIEDMPVEYIKKLEAATLKAIYIKSWGLDCKILIGFTNRTNTNLIFIERLYTIDPNSLEEPELKSPFYYFRDLLRKPVSIKVNGRDIDYLDHKQEVVICDFEIAENHVREDAKKHNGAALTVNKTNIKLLMEVEQMLGGNLRELLGEVDKLKTEILAKEKQLQELDTTQLDSHFREQQSILDSKIFEFDTIIKEQEGHIHALTEELRLIQLQKEQEIEKLEHKLTEELKMLETVFNTNRGKLFHQESRKLFINIPEKKYTKEFVEGDLVTEIWNRLNQCNYSADEGFIRNILSLLCTNKICIFAGTCGSGKSSLIEKIGEVCGAEVTFIPVKSNWHSPEDMIGYYDSQKECFIPATDFVKAIHTAHRDKDRLHIIALDEMNLARVEYYFADILSLLELTDPLKREIKLYSWYSGGTQDPNTGIEGDCVIGTKILKIPENVRFIGTMNIDETTYYLSPKVLDRVHIVRFDSEKEFQQVNEIKPYENLGDNKCLDYSYFSPKDLSIDQALISPYQEYLKEINTILLDYKKEFGYRIFVQFNEYMAICQNMGMDLPTAFENFICQKILPRLNIYDGKELIETLRNTLINKAKISKVGAVATLLNKIATKPLNNYYSYWNV